MTVRVGVGAVPLLEPDRDLGSGLADLVDTAEALGVDSVWLSDLVSSPVAVDPLVGLAYAAARTSRLKLGTGVLILPGRNPAIVAAQLASLAGLAPRRILPVFGSRPARGPDRSVFAAAGATGVEVFEEAVGLVRALLTQPRVEHHGAHFQLVDASVAPLPARPLDLWLGGRVRAALERVGRLADGWLGSFVTPAEAAIARTTIERAAAAAGRCVEDDHYATNLVVALTDEQAESAAAVGAAARADLADPTALVACGWQQAREQLRQFVDAGVSKFVVRPAGPVASRREFLEAFCQELGPSQT